MPIPIIGSLLSTSAASASQAALGVASESLQDFLNEEETQETIKDIVSSSVASSSEAVADVLSSKGNLNRFLNE